VATLNSTLMKFHSDEEFGNTRTAAIMT